jgi:hypothetical protein
MQFTVDTGLAVAGVALGFVTVGMAAPPLSRMIYDRSQLDIAADEFTGALTANSFLWRLRTKALYVDFCESLVWSARLVM